jgi:hypothetical protein
MKRIVLLLVAVFGVLAPSVSWAASQFTGRRPGWTKYSKKAPQAGRPAPIAFVSLGSRPLPAGGER